MPIYEYECKSCGHQFEQVVLPKSTPACPSCHGKDLERQLSMFAVDSDATRKANLRSGKKHAAKTTRDKLHAEHEAIHHHHH